MSIAKIFLSLIVTLTFAEPVLANYGPRNCSQHRSKSNGFAWDERRGNPWDFDTGPVGEESASWVKLYGQVPNYRTVGRAILGGDKEKFRWTMGPMWYRGRLGQNQVKVFVVGQEGAQDENVTNRAFTGSTGTRVQKFLNHLGIYESYLYMNTYVYTIKEQRDLESARYMALEQDIDSPVVQYRHQLFDNVVKQNPESLALLMAVGGGGKESLATWINSRSGNNKCKSWALDRCDTSGLVKHFTLQGVLKGDEKIMAVGVQHPGGAAFGEGFKRIQKSFDGAASSVARYLQKNKEWLPADLQEARFANCNGGDRIKRLFKSFRYGHAPIPFKDFSFGTNWRMGNRGTSSNRDGAHRIQVFSEEGQYATVYRGDKDLGKVKLDSGRTIWNDWEPGYLYDERSTRSRDFKGMSYAQKMQILKENTYTAQANSARLQLRDSKKGLMQEMKETEVPYEHPRYAPFGCPEQGDFEHAAAFDPGPATAAIAEALGNWPNFSEINNKAFYNHPSFGFGPSYRGNTKNPKVVIIADQMGHSDFFSTRALTGAGGQWLQSFLKNTGLESESGYLILRSLPVDTLSYSEATEYLGTLTAKNLTTQTSVYSSKRKKAALNHIQSENKKRIEEARKKAGEIADKEGLDPDAKKAAQMDAEQAVELLTYVDQTTLRPISIEEKVALALSADSSGRSVVDNLRKAIATFGEVQVVTMGPVAQAISESLNIKTVSMEQPKSDASHTANWIEIAKVLKLSKVPTQEQLQAMTSIPRKDLPYSTRWWMGSTGERAERAFGASIVDQSFNYEGHYYRVVAPDWSRKLYDDPRPMNEVEKSFVDSVLQKLTAPTECTNNSDGSEPC